MPRKPLRAGAVVVTGASTGIGRATALALAEAGYHVFAGIRRPADGEALREAATGRLTPLLIDVTDAVSLEKAVAEVASVAGQEGVVAVVNNAGIGVTGPMETVPPDALRRQYEVNVFGQVAVVQAFLPLVRAAAGRIVTIGSVGDRLTPPFAGPLASSKWAIASITEALRIELRPWGIHVVLIEPASIRTDAVAKFEADAARVVAGFSEEQRALYGDAYRSMTHRFAARESKGSDPGVAARTVLRAITSERPKTRYLTGKDARLMAFAARWAPDRLFDLMRVRLFGLPRTFGGRRQDTGRRL